MSNNSDILLIVLVVDDDCVLRSLVVDYLEDAGCKVVEAATAKQAIALCNSGVPLDVVVTDINLAGRLNGWDVGEAARSARGEIPVVYTSGSSPVEHARPVPGSLFLNKPCRPADILEACQNLRRAKAPGRPRAEGSP